MNIYNSFDTVPQIENAVLALGTFDGMHLAHRRLAEKLCQDARGIKGNSIVVSFLAHPRKTIAKNYNHGVLTTPSEKTDIFAQIGLDNLIIMDFSTDIANMSYIEFIDFLQKKIGIQKIILGYNHHFGKNREGCYTTLLKLGKERHFEVEKFEKQTIDGLDISSSSIRHALSCGDIETANKLLGYNYSICIKTHYNENEDNEETPKKTLGHCGLDPQSSAKMLFTSELQLNPAMTEIQKTEFFRSAHDVIFFDTNKLLPKNGRYIVEINGINFFAIVKQPQFTIEAMDRADEI